MFTFTTKTLCCNSTKLLCCFKWRRQVQKQKKEIDCYWNSSKCNHTGPVWESNPGPLAPKARIMPLDQQGIANRHTNYILYKKNYPCSRFASGSVFVLELGVIISKCKYMKHIFWTADETSNRKMILAVTTQLKQLRKVIISSVLSLICSSFKSDIHHLSRLWSWKWR